MNRNEFESPSADSSAQRNPCCETTHKHSFALGVMADDGHDYSPFAGFFTRRRIIGIIFILWGLLGVIYGLSTHCRRRRSFGAVEQKRLLIETLPITIDDANQGHLAQGL